MNGHYFVQFWEHALFVDDRNNREMGARQRGSGKASCMGRREGRERERRDAI